jgi:hypothetical protein
MIQLSNRLREVIDQAERDFSALTEPESAVSTQPGAWSRKQILGHLIDSASNNHQRFVRALLQDELTWPSYDQEGCVRAQRYQEAKWADLVRFWSGYNRFLAHILAGVPESKRNTRCLIGNNAPMTLEELAVDYLKHMQHHLDQIKSRT